jgi:endo-alpha-1,4-polygalactosaminidase (GH114 family)
MPDTWNRAKKSKLKQLHQRGFFGLVGKTVERFGGKKATYPALRKKQQKRILSKKRVAHATLSMTIYRVT